ncbi:MAG TPA: hypothetical protein VGR20_00580, partial [Acidimicrobiia bacterium]|nr:hypothetical protein [Acidimicrobiia bacterium]
DGAPGGTDVVAPVAPPLPTAAASGPPAADPVLSNPMAAGFGPLVPELGGGPTLEVAAPRPAEGTAMPIAPAASGAAPVAAAPTLVRNAWWARKINTGTTFYPFLLVAGGLFIGGLRAARTAGGN